MTKSGLTLLEVLIAIAIIGIALGALAFSQLTSLRASVNTRHITEVKAAASVVLERKMAEVLRVEETGSLSSLTDQEWENSDGETVYRSFYFIDYYYSCPDEDGGSPRQLRSDIECAGEVEVDTDPITAYWTVEGQGGVMGEGLVIITVTADHAHGGNITLVDVITCYDVYPSPTSDTPKPCPEPSETGGGRS